MSSPLYRWENRGSGERASLPGYPARQWCSWGSKQTRGTPEGKKTGSNLGVGRKGEKMQASPTVSLAPAARELAGTAKPSGGSIYYRVFLGLEALTGFPSRGEVARRQL